MWFSIPWLLAIGFLFTSIYVFFWKDQISSACGMLVLAIFSLRRICSDEIFNFDDIDKILILIISILGVASAVENNPDAFNIEKQNQNISLVLQTATSGFNGCLRYFQSDDKKRKLFNDNLILLNKTCAAQSTNDFAAFVHDLTKATHLPARVGGVDTMINTFDTKDGPLTCTELKQQMDKWCPNFLRLK